MSWVGFFQVCKSSSVTVVEIVLKHCVLCGLHVAVFSKNNVDSGFERGCLAQLILFHRVLLASRFWELGK